MKNAQTYAKIFRWRLPDGHTEKPAKVEVAGTFNNWQKVPLMRDGVLDAWHVTLHQIPGNRTHHYMLFVDGKPAQDKHCDGLAVPHGPLEEQYALQTIRGPRVFMLFAQTK
ncbi:MAG TPA: glycogen-binding domain-containing protein [Candidatus Saccharimonadales bacterium]|nr:glycogen-binding domain-containing protein [Candidatus Saccharimonadales bacterium]